MQGNNARRPCHTSDASTEPNSVSPERFRLGIPTRCNPPTTTRPLAPGLLCLQVTVVAARSLMPRAGGQLLLGLQAGAGQQVDAYANVVFGGARQATPVVRQSQNPRWVQR